MFHALQQKLSRLTSYPIFSTLLSTSIRNAMQSFEIPLSLLPLTTSFFAGLSDAFKETIFISLSPIFSSSVVFICCVHSGMRCMICSHDIISLPSNSALPSGYLFFRFLRLFILTYTYTTIV